MLSLSKKKKTAQPVKKVSTDSGSSDSDSDWGAKAKVKKISKKKKMPGKRSRRATASSDDDEKSDTESFIPPPPSTVGTDKKTCSDLEEGEVSSESSGSDSESEFDDGYDENLMGDEEDKKRLNMMTEKEREQELFKRVEQREAMRTRFDIEKKLRQAKKKEMKK